MSHLAPQSSVAYIKYASLLFRGDLGHPEPARCRSRGSGPSILFTNRSIRPRRLEPERERALSKRGAFVASWRGRRQAAEAGADPRSGYAEAPLSAPTMLRGSNEPRFLLTLREPWAPHLAPQSSVAYTYIKYASLLFRGNLGHPEPARCRGRGSGSSVLFTNRSIRPRGPELFSNYSKIVLAFGWIIPYIKSSQADIAQLVEHNLAKVGVAGSSPVVRSIWAFSSGGERFPDTEEVRSSNLLTPTKCSQLRGYVL